jgi:hypothetical protein
MTLATEIRLKKISARSKKPIYSHLSKLEANYCKTRRQIIEIEHEIHKADRIEPAWRTTEWGQYLLEQYLKAIEKYNKLQYNIYSSIKNKTEDEIDKYLNTIYQSTSMRGYGGSY